MLLVPVDIASHENEYSMCKVNWSLSEQLILK